MRALALCSVLSMNACSGLVFGEGLGRTCSNDTDCAEGACVDGHCGLDAPGCARGRCDALSASQRIGVDGGVVEIPGVVTIDVPAGALPDGTVLTARIVGDPDAPLLRDPSATPG